jgi:DNA damage-binding protein 1
LHSLTELNVLSICFLPVPVFSQTYVLAILHRDYSGKLQLLARDLSIHGQELSMEPSIIFHQVTIDENDASTLVPMPASGDTPAGILVLGGQSILYFEVGARESADKGKGKDKSAKGKGRRKRDSETIGSGTEPCAQIDWPLCDITS